MAYSPQIDDLDVAGFVPGPEIVRPDLKFGIAMMREALAPEIGRSEFNPESSETCFGHDRSERSGRARIVATLAHEQVAT